MWRRTEFFFLIVFLLKYNRQFRKYMASRGFLLHFVCLLVLGGFWFVCVLLFYVLTENKAVAFLTLSQ